MSRDIDTATENLIWEAVEKCVQQGVTPVEFVRSAMISWEQAHDDRCKWAMSSFNKALDGMQGRST
jgi:hypothetical protein